MSFGLISAKAEDQRGNDTLLYRVGLADAVVIGTVNYRTWQIPKLRDFTVGVQRS